MKTDKSKKYLDELRHSCAHLLAAAVIDLWPSAKRTIGPAIENGFYYDFDFGKIKVSEKDFPKIENKMRQILPTWNEFKRREVSVKEAKNEYKDNKYKLELIDEFTKEDQKLTFYISGNYSDLCRGGHVKNPKEELKNFKLLSIAGAYWRGDEKNNMLTRIYGTVFPTKKELDDYLALQEEAKKRDHRVLGKSMDLFSTNLLTGAGLILWHPKLSISRNEIENYWKKEHIKAGYNLVYTPHIGGMDMFVKSRHYTKYINSMFPVMLHQYIEGESKSDYTTDEQLKPMNCPNHIQIYNTKPKSYRELPLKMAELGTVYRYERAGTLHGLTRVRGFTQDDSHIFCTPEQVIDEVRGVLKLTKKFYELLGFTNYKAYVATRPEKFLGTTEMWDFAENSLKKAAELEKLDFEMDEGEGVFYGPKIDSKIKDSLGREWQLGTVQFDFNLPAKAETTSEEIEDFWKLKTFKDKFKTKESLAKYLKKLGRGFDANYIDADGKEKQVIMIHRTILGSMERFFGVLIEHFAGAFPTWLAPVQVKILPISEKQFAYANQITKLLSNNSIRTELDSRNETLQAKIRDAQIEKVPYMAIIGQKEENEKNVTIRSRDGKINKSFTIKSFLDKINSEIEGKIVN